MHTSSVVKYCNNKKENTFAIIFCWREKGEGGACLKIQFRSFNFNQIFVVFFSFFKCFIWNSDTIFSMPSLLSIVSPYITGGWFKLQKKKMGRKLRIKKCVSTVFCHFFFLIRVHTYYIYILKLPLFLFLLVSFCSILFTNFCKKK